MGKQCFVFIVCYVIVLSHAISQTPKIDSLRSLYSLTGSPERKLELLFSLCEERQSLQNDSLFKFANEAIAISKSIHAGNDVLRASFYLDNALLKKGLITGVVTHCNEQLAKLGATPQNKKLQLDIIHLKGVALIRSEQYKEAIRENFRLLGLAEKYRDTLMQIKGRNSIGWAYMEMGQNRNSIEWFKRALTTTDNLFYFKKYPIVYNNIASCYNNVQLYDSALFFVNKNLVPPITNDLTSLANALNIKADILLNLGKTSQAQQLLEEALAVRKRIGDPYYVVSDLYQLAVFYSNNGQPAKGITMAKEGIEMARLFGLKAKLPLLYTGLAQAYRQAGDETNYARGLETIIALKDSLFENNSAEALADMQAKYDVQKKENIIMQQKLSILQKDNFIIGISMATLVATVLFIYLYTNYRHKQKIKLVKMVAEQKQNEKTAVQDAEEAQRKHIAAELHDNLGAQISFINSNIDWIIDSPTPINATEQKDRLQMVHDTSQGLMRTLRETIWALNRDKISLEEFSDKLKAYIQTYLQFQPAMHFRAEEAINTNLTLKPIEALNIFRIYQEGVNNAIKYSKAANLTLIINTIGGQFVINLADDGIGFEPASVNGDHYGLGIMKQRAKEGGFSLLVTSSHGNGTKIMLSGTA